MDTQVVSKIIEQKIHSFMELSIETFKKIIVAHGVGKSIESE